MLQDLARLPCGSAQREKEFSDSSENTFRLEILATENDRVPPAPKIKNQIHDRDTYAWCILFRLKHAEGKILNRKIRTFAISRNDLSAMGSGDYLNRPSGVYLAQAFR